MTAHFEAINETLGEITLEGAAETPPRFDRQTTPAATIDGCDGCGRTTRLLCCGACSLLLVGLILLIVALASPFRVETVVERMSEFDLDLSERKHCGYSLYQDADLNRDAVAVFAGISVMDPRGVKDLADSYPIRNDNPESWENRHSPRLQEVAKVTHRWILSVGAADIPPAKLLGVYHVSSATPLWALDACAIHRAHRSKSALLWSGLAIMLAGFVVACAGCCRSCGMIPEPHLYEKQQKPQEHPDAFPGGMEAAEKPAAEHSWRVVIGGTLGVIGCLYVFLMGLELLGDGFKCLGGRGAGGMFDAISNPVAGLMVGILATVLVQSSSTSTSIVVALVGADQMSVKTAIPVIMGANIGTSVTNTLVSMGQSGDRITLQRAFSGATVHDMFNMLTVLALLPLEVVVGAIQGSGGPLYWITKVLADEAMANGQKGDDPLKDKSPTKMVTSPVVEAVIQNNKHVISALSLGAPTALVATGVNASAGCSPLIVRRLGERRSVVEMETSRALLSRRLGDLDCSRFYCVGGDMRKSYETISPSGWKGLTRCAGYVDDGDARRCDKDACVLGADAFYRDVVAQEQIIDGGFLKGAGDIAGGVIALTLALSCLGGGLMGLCKLLKLLLMGTARKYIAQATRMNDYVAMLIGMVVTIIVQSSSVTTSALTPLCGIGVLPLHKMLPLTLGANIGTTTTALIASIAAFTHDAVHIALCHLFFNVIGILIWFPVPFMREVPLGAARLLGLYASHYRAVPAVYISIAFVLGPGILLGLSAIFDASVAGGVVAAIFLAAAVGCFEFWWLCLGGCYKVLSLEARREREDALQAADAEIGTVEVARAGRPPDSASRGGASGQVTQAAPGGVPHPSADRDDFDPVLFPQ